MGIVASVAAVVAMRLLLLLPLGLGTAVAAEVATGPGSSCSRSCGNISVPYPFGMEPGCYHEGFNLTCDRSSRPPKLFLGDGTVQVVEISIPTNTVRINSSRLLYTVDQGRSTANGTWGLGLPQGPDSPYFLVEEINRLALVGCGAQVDLRGGEGNSLIASCTTVCPLDASERIVVETGSACTGIGCCEVNIVLGYPSYDIQIHRLNGAAYALPPAAVYLVDRGFSYSADMTIYDNYPEALPASLGWVMGNWTCFEGMDMDSYINNNSTFIKGYECKSFSSGCRDVQSGSGYGYQCYCDDGYQGNPYIPEGCQDIDECSYQDVYPCYGDCTNTQGSYICQCPAGYTGNASIPNGCKDVNECDGPESHSCHGVCLNFPGTFQCQCPNGTYGNPLEEGGCIAIKNSSKGLGVGLGVGCGIGLLLLAFGGPIIMRKFKHRKVKMMKRNFFKQNHGLLLQQLISRKVDIGERMIITLRELEKATGNFDKARVVGGGGHGVVFKGILDLHVVAIKKAKIVVQREIDEFVNEVAVLSQVNHRNVVKLLGCCLEAEVPLLVYEFISNGTLYHHLHVEGPQSLSWVDRIRIAMEVARALSYLHSAASMPIFHRDIKSSNILLDDSLTAKVSDFGASRYIPIDHTGVTTAVQGTIGYLDPMYYYTGRLTDKSDVFSFGVLLIELLTRKKPYLYRSDDGEGLVSHFVELLAKGKLEDIIDRQVMEEEANGVQEVATLAERCTKLKGEDRPTMREVEITLENLLVTTEHAPCTSTPQRIGDENVAVLEDIPTVQVAKDPSRQYTMEEEMLLSARYPR